MVAIGESNKRVYQLTLTALTAFVVIATAVLYPISATADEGMNKLSKALVNPIGKNWMINTYLDVGKMQGDLSNESAVGAQWLIQPVIPISLNNKGLTLMNRPTLPIILKDPDPQTDTSGNFTKFANYSGIGDLVINSALGNMQKTSSGMYMWGLGLSLTFPTASRSELGSGKYSAGPDGMLVGFTRNYTFGFTFQQAWSYAGDKDAESVNLFTLQPLYYKQLGGGWQLGDNPAWKIDWDAAGGEQV